MRSAGDSAACCVVLTLAALPSCSSVRQAGDKEGRCGWRWCLQQLAASSSAAADARDVPTALDDEEGGGGKDWDPAKLLRSVLQQVDVQKH